MRAPQIVTEPDAECVRCERRFYSADSIAADTPICPRHRKRTPAPRARAITARDHAIAAIREAHARHVATWYPNGGAPSYLAADLDADERAIASWLPGQPFGWIVTPASTHIMIAGGRWPAASIGPMAWRCLTCTRHGTGSPAPDRCPSCDSERYPDHGPQMIANLGAIVSRSYPEGARYLWDGVALAAVATADDLDERLTAFGGWRPAVRL